MIDLIRNVHGTTTTTTYFYFLKIIYNSSMVCGYPYGETWKLCASILLGWSSNNFLLWHASLSPLQGLQGKDHQSGTNRLFLLDCWFLHVVASRTVSLPLSVSSHVSSLSFFLSFHICCVSVEVVSTALSIFGCSPALSSHPGWLQCFLCWIYFFQTSLWWLTCWHSAIHPCIPSVKW